MTCCLGAKPSVRPATTHTEGPPKGWQTRLRLLRLDARCTAATLLQHASSRLASLVRVLPPCAPLAGAAVLLCSEAAHSGARTGVVDHGTLGGAERQVQADDARDEQRLPARPLQPGVPQEVGCQRACRGESLIH